MQTCPPPPPPPPPTYTWALVNRGVLPIPPTGAGATEDIIWEYKIHLEKLGHKAFIINTTNRRKITSILNRRRPDIVHLHYAPYAKAVGKTGVPMKIFTDHHALPLLPSTAVRPEFFNIPLFHFLKYDFFLGALSAVYADRASFFIDSPKIFMTPNGVNTDKFRFRATPIHHDRSIYLARVASFKRQHLVQDIASIDFVGPLPPYGHRYDKFEQTRGNYLGEWTRDHVYEHLSDYANLVLLSRIEATTPLVVAEAMACGLGVVVSTVCTSNLDLSLPWVSVIPENKLDDLAFVEAEITRNREISLRWRKKIRAYAVENYSWKKLVSRYAELCIHLHTRAGERRPRTISRAKLARLYFSYHVPTCARKAARIAWHKCSHPKELLHSLAIRRRR